ncbi:hypothetical protein KR222_003223 [Zaprionus bogoriensis]|nr:hypothetical protein KR222_003223 [Zaprionus bogoriensis]
MSNLPENLQITRVELVGTPEKSKIKERLNLHVKRRLLQDASTGGAEIASASTDPCGGSAVSKSCKSTFTQSKVQKSRKPYQKRAVKIKEEYSNCKNGDLDTFDELADLECVAESSDAKNINRERLKGTDILNMVLKKKKLELMLNPDVQSLWSKIMSALKS